MRASECPPDPRDMEGFDAYMGRFKALLEVERAAAERM